MESPLNIIGLVQFSEIVIRIPVMKDSSSDHLLAGALSGGEGGSSSYEIAILKRCLAAAAGDAFFDEIIQILRKAAGCSAAALRVISGGSLRHFSSGGFPDTFFSADLPLADCEQLITDAMISRDIEQAALSGFNSSETFPLTVNGVTAGYVLLCDRARDLYDGNSRQIMESFCGYISSALQRFSDEEALQVNRNVLRETQRIARVGRWELSRKSGLIKWSESIYELFELSPATTIPSLDLVMSFVPDDEKSVLEKAISDSGTSGKIYEIIHRLIMPDGRTKWVKQAGHTIFDKEGAALGIIGTIQDITDLKRVEEALDESVTASRLIFESVPVGIGISSLDGIQLEANIALEKIFGYDRDQMKGLPVSSAYLNAEDRERLVARLQKEKSIRDYEVDFRRKDGTVINALLNVDLLELPGEKVLITTVRDVTKMNRIIESLRASEKKYRFLFDAVSVGVTITDMEGRILDSNVTARNMLGYSVDEMQTLNIKQVYANPEVDRERFMNLFLRDGFVRKEEGVFRAKDGSPVICAVNLEHIDVLGENYILAIVLDITARKQAEESFRKSYDLLTNLASRVPGVLFQHRFHPDGRSAVQYVSPEILNLYGLSVEEALADGESMFRKIHPEDMEWVISEVNRCGKNLNFFHAEFRLMKSEDEIIWVSCDAKPVRTEDGGTLWHGIIINIDERKINEEDRERLRAQLNQSQRMEFIGRLAGGIAHDFNNLLTVIMTNAEIALLSMGDPQTGAEEITEIKKAATRAADLTRQLLAFARKQVIEPVVININETISSMMKMINRLIGENIALVWRPASSVWPVKIDPTQLDQILVNLAVNARDAISGVGSITIETENTTADEAFSIEGGEFAPGDYVLITISDTGTGMRREVLEHVFEPFYTTKEIGKGTGLGLATVYGAVRQNNGYVSVFSELDIGTTFRIYLPRTYLSSDELDAHVETAAAGGTETILVAEDEPSILELSKTILERFGYTVLAAGSPKEALNLSTVSETIDLLLTDIVMPEMNGRELSQIIGKTHPQIKVLYVSGYSADIIEHQGVIEAGVNFLHKPFSIRALLNKVRDILDSPA